MWQLHSTHITYEILLTIVWIHSVLVKYFAQIFSVVVLVHAVILAPYTYFDYNCAINFLAERK